MASSATDRMSKEDWKKKNELDELRKSGAIEPEKDEDGNEINPHIPQYMSQAPWYLNAKGPGLKHQRNLKIVSVAEGQAARTVQAVGKSKVISRTRDEFGERIDTKPKGQMAGAAPRANGYDTTFEGKRDRWNGYDAQQYLRVIQKYELKDQERKKLREAEIEASLQEGGSSKSKEKKQDDDESDSSSSDDDEGVDVEKAELLDRDGGNVGQTIDTGRIGMQTRVSVRNLRIREDTAKYLRNLDVRSAYYDPKTRSMRSNPNPEQNAGNADYAGENFIRYSGDAIEVAKQQLYEFEAFERGQTVHMQAMPTQAERLHKTFEDKKEKLVDKVLFTHTCARTYTHAKSCSL
jgi:pre-mRNA-processing factor SLU7